MRRTAKPRGATRRTAARRSGGKRPAEMVIGVYTYLTKLHFLELKERLAHTYIRDDFDRIIVTTPEGEVTIAQDGLIYLRTERPVEELERLERWLKENVLRDIAELEGKESSFTRILLASRPTVILLEPGPEIKELYRRLSRKYDYEIASPHLTKTYGEGLITYRDIALHGERLRHLIEYQLLLAEYQDLARELLHHNERIDKEIKRLRQREEIRYRELPEIINVLMDRRQEVNGILKKVEQLDDFLEQRGERCRIRDLLEALKLHDFTEMVRLNNYVRDQFDLTMRYIASTIELSEFVYKENEQKELNILQVIFAIGTIATIVSLGAMPGAQLFLTISGDAVSGEIVSFDGQTLLVWTVISVVIGLLLFLALNYLFLYAKKVRIIKPFRRR